LLKKGDIQTKTRLGIFALGLLMIIGLLGASCGGKSGPNVVGKWKVTQDQGEFNNWEFLKDGTLVWNLAKDSGMGTTVSWGYSFPDYNHMNLTANGNVVTYDFSLSGDTLTLTDGSDTIILLRIK